MKIHFITSKLSVVNLTLFFVYFIYKNIFFDLLAIFSIACPGTLYFREVNVFAVEQAKTVEYNQEVENHPVIFLLFSKLRFMNSLIAINSEPSQAIRLHGFG